MAADALESFEDFFQREISALVAFVRKLGYGFEDAQDAAAQAMTKAYEHWVALKTPRAWVRVAVSRIALRDAKRQRDATASAIDKWRLSQPKITDYMELVDQRHRVLALLNSLPPQQREVMAWHLDGFETAEIARHLGISETTVRSTKRHARELLKKRLHDLRRMPGEEGIGYGA